MPQEKSCGSAATTLRPTTQLLLLQKAHCSFRFQTNLKPERPSLDINSAPWIEVDEADPQHLYHVRCVRMIIAIISETTTCDWLQKDAEAHGKQMMADRPFILGAMPQGFFTNNPYIADDRCLAIKPRRMPPKVGPRFGVFWPSSFTKWVSDQLRNVNVTAAHYATPTVAAFFWRTLNKLKFCFNLLQLLFCFVLTW